MGSLDLQTPVALLAVEQLHLQVSRYTLTLRWRGPSAVRKQKDVLKLLTTLHRQVWGLKICCPWRFQGLGAFFFEGFFWHRSIQKCFPRKIDFE